MTGLIIESISNPSTDRYRETSKNVVCEVGIDTVRVGGITSNDRIAGMLTSTHRHEVDRGSGEIREIPSLGYEPLFLDQDLSLQVGSGPGERAYWWVEFSLPRRLSGSNDSPAGPAMLLPALRDLQRAVADRLGSVDDPTNWAVRRLDVARDFHAVTARGLLLDGLAAVSVPHATMKVRRFGAAGSCGTQSLSKGTRKRYVATLYDKHLETLDRTGDGTASRPGHLRYELSLRRPVLRDHGVWRVGDITEPIVQELGRKFFKKCGYDREVRGMNRAMLEITLVHDQLTTQETKQLTKMLGILHLQAAGMDPGVSGVTLKTHLDLARRLGLSAADFVNPGDHSLRLDFDSGSQVHLGGPKS